MQNKRLGRMPSPATVIACLALFVAISGTSYAAGKINGKKLKNRSVTAGKVKKDTLTGTEINESKLGKVPSAQSADSATTAGNASTVGGANLASLKTKCPSGTAVIAGECMETAVRPDASYSDALDTCGDAGRRLPSPGEVRAYSRLPGVTIEYELTDVVYQDDDHGPTGVSRDENTIIGESGSLSFSFSPDTPRPYRCITAASN